MRKSVCLVALALLTCSLTSNIRAQVNPSSAQPRAELPEQGDIQQAYVVAVEIRTNSQIGSYTAV